MTAQQIYEIASAFLYENNNEDMSSKAFSPFFINLLLQEALDTENSIREYKGKDLLEQAPYIESLDEVIDYDDAITKVALPYGVASFFYQEAMNNYQAENYRNKYISALREAAKYKVGGIIDIYGGSDNA